MTRWLRLLSQLVLITAFCVLGTACSNGGDGASPKELPNELTGVILNIDAHEFGDIRSFELKVGDEIHVIYTEPDREYGFPLGHLTEHLQTSEPVRVTLRHDEGKFYALEIEDA